MKSTTITPLALATKWLRDARKNQSPLYRYDVTFEPAIENFGNKVLMLHAPNEEAAKEFIKLQMRNLHGVEVEITEVKADGYWFPHKADGIMHYLTNQSEHKVSKS